MEGGSTDPMKNMVANGMMIYNGMDHSAITDNRFETVHQAITVKFSREGPYRDALIARNTGTGIHRMGIELQGDNTGNITVEDNVFSDFLDPNPGTFGISVAVDGGYHSVIRNNHVVARPAAVTPTPLGTRYGIGIEIGGKDATVYGNRVEGFWGLGIAIGTAPHAIVRENYLCGSPGSMEIKNETNLKLEFTVENNVAELACKTGPRRKAARAGANEQ